MPAIHPAYKCGCMLHNNRGMVATVTCINVCVKLLPSTHSITCTTASSTTTSSHAIQTKLHSCIGYMGYGYELLANVLLMIT